MDKIIHRVKFEGQDEVEIDFVNTPNKGDIIVHNEEDFEVKTISHTVQENDIAESQAPKIQIITIFALRSKRL